MRSDAHPWQRACAPTRPWTLSTAWEADPHHGRRADVCAPGSDGLRSSACVGRHRDRRARTHGAAVEPESPSPDPSGVAWDPGANRFVVSDSEVEEMAIFQDANLFELDLQGNLTGTGDVTRTRSRVLQRAHRVVVRSRQRTPVPTAMTSNARSSRCSRGPTGTSEPPTTRWSVRSTPHLSDATTPRTLRSTPSSGHLFVADGCGP